MKQSIGRGIFKRFFGESTPGSDAAKDMKLLIVDDEERFLYSMETLLTRKGYTVQTASSGARCLEILSEKQVDVMILDIKMPGLDGLEVLKRVKQAYPLIEVILLTGHATVESAVEGLKCGAADFLMKPISASDLIEKVRDAYARRRAAEKKIQEAQSKRFMQQSPGDIIRDAGKRTGHDNSDA